MIPLCEPLIEGNEWKYIKDCLDTNWVSSVGGYVDLFEEKFKRYVQSKAAVVAMNGTSAITLALQVLGVGQGNEVIVPSMTFAASVNPIKYVGAEPVFIDITPDTWVMDVEKVEELITPRTRAFLPVHIYGNVVDMEPLLKLAEKYNLYIIEDATEALGSEYRTSDGVWHKVGTMGHFGAFSFNGNKLITTGAGGMLVTNNVVYGNKAKHLSNQAKIGLDNGGMYHEEVGYNYRMPNILAAMGAAQMEKIDDYLSKKIQHAKLYDKLLMDVGGVQLPCQKENVKHSQWMYSVLINSEYEINRDNLIKKLKDNGIMSRPFFSAIHQMKPYKESKAGEMETTNKVVEKGINLPSSVGLKEEEVEYICSLIRRDYKNGKSI
ncbi:MAG: aminotransferase class I/II-fold pyridoxal phosphate-dependent enzyme [Deltaproteobacteria bacterium]